MEAWASNISMPPVMRAISLAMNTPSSKDVSANIDRTAKPLGLLGVSARAPPGLCTITVQAACNISGVER